VKITRALPIVLGLLLISSRPATAQTFSVSSGTLAKMTITTAVAGSQPTSVTNTATTYNVRVRSWQGIKHITAQIDLAMPAGTTLQLSMVPPAGATSPGLVTLTTTAQSIVNNIANVNPTVTLPITYKFSATAAAGVVATFTRRVTLTMVTGP
jgi:hypothetical protein